MKKLFKGLLVLALLVAVVLIFQLDLHKNFSLSAIKENIAALKAYYLMSFEVLKDSGNKIKNALDALQ